MMFQWEITTDSAYAKKKSYTDGLLCEIETDSLT